MPLMDTALSAHLLRDLLADRIADGEPGATVAVYRDGTLIASASRGLADTETGDPLTPATPTNIASVSKQITATTVLLAARRGEVDLDADLRELIPELSLPGITLRNCLNHTGGLPDYFAVIDLMGSSEIEMSGLDTFLTWVGTLTALDFAPGTAQSYSNTGYVLAALATERGSGTPYPELITRTVFEPLGMTHSFVTTLLGEYQSGMAMSFSPSADGFTRWGMGIGEVGHERVVNGDGEVITTLEDFAHWHGFLLDGRVLGADIRAQLLERTVLWDGRVSDYGLGIEHETRGGTSATAHSGGMWGYSTYSLVDPASGISVALFANRDDLGAIELAWQAYRIATGAAGVNGRWFTRDGCSALELRVLGTGDLRASEGDAPEILRRDGTARWTRDDDLSVVELVDGHLRAAPGFGVLEAYERLTPAGPVPAAGLGAFTEPFRGASLRTELRGDELWLTPASGVAERVTPYGVRGSEWIGQTSLGWLLI
ncbi:serine hydrolase domain-containing protein, partial [Leucobacter sp. M11]|uniref:serine hydrolase domain-containing protein n=1 Tax=Leucobacter sp. M11 TaxID=2993565 RepID=UPI002D809D81